MAYEFRFCPRTSVWNYTFDTGGRVITLQNPFGEVTEWLYNGADLPVWQRFHTGATVDTQYDAQHRAIDVWHKTSGGATLGRYQYLYNAQNPYRRTDNDGSVTNFGYDGANQLISEVRTGPNPYSIGYLYDNNGNRTQKTVNGVPEVYTYGPNDRILTAGNRSYVTANNGNVTSVTVGGQTTGLTYDFENRVTRTDFPNGTHSTFNYNGLGLRLRKGGSGGITQYYVDGWNPGSDLIADSSATFTPRVSERRGTTSKFYHGDHLGSIRGITNTGQSDTDSILYDAFGGVISRTGTTPTPFGYVGGAVPDGFRFRNYQETRV